MNEAERQQALLRAIAGEVPSEACALRETGERARRGLEAYRANAEAIAERALGGAFATVQAMVGAEDFARLAREFWRASPPLCGDLGEWGDAFPAWLGAHAAMTPWPYLGDCAKLDLALHRCERAADAMLDAASLTLLASTDPARLHLQLMPGTGLVGSAWPIASIHHAHRLEGLEAERAFEAVRALIDEPRGESALVVRQGWRAVVRALDAATSRWTQSLLASANLDAAFEHAGSGFEFTAWLATALRESTLKGVTVSRD